MIMFQSKGSSICNFTINLNKLTFISPKGMVSKIFFSMSSPSLAVISEEINPGATALIYRTRSFTYLH